MDLINNVEELKKYVSVIATSEIESIKPYIRLAQRNYLLPILGSAFIASMETAYQETEPLDEKDQMALNLMQEVLANLAVMHALPVLSVNIGTNGIMVVKNDQMAPASQWRTVQVLESLAEVGFKAIDALLSLLEEEKAHFTLWANDPVYDVYTQYFIRSAAEFNAYYNIKDSRFLFHTISYCMRRVETFEIKAALGAALFEELKSQDQAGTIDGYFKTLLQDFIKPATALFTVAKALQERLITMTAGNVALKFSGSHENMDESRPPLLNELNQTIASIREDARTYTALAAEFIAAQPDTFLPFTPQTSSRRRMNAANGPDRDLFIF